MKHSIVLKSQGLNYIWNVKKEEKKEFENLKNKLGGPHYRGLFLLLPWWISPWIGLTRTRAYIARRTAIASATPRVHT